MGCEIELLLVQIHIVVLGKAGILEVTEPVFLISLVIVK